MMFVRINRELLLDKYLFFYRPHFNMQKIKIGATEIFEPRQLVYDILKYRESGTVLDLGAGFGRHALFLAHKGFVVTAIENDEDKILSLRKKTEELGIPISIVQSDIRGFETPRKFDIVIATMVLHFLPQQEVPEMVRKMQDWTTQDGLNVVSIYTEQNIENLREYLFKQNELKG